jgi:signal transduction histidine kinase
MKIKIVFIVLFVFCNFCAQSDIKWQNYNTDNGLPQNSVKDIIKDKYGFIWISTERGITRFDGEQFLTSKLWNNRKRYTNFHANKEKDTIFNLAEEGNEAAVITHRKLIRKTVSLKNLTRTIVHNNKQYRLFDKNSVIMKGAPNSRHFIYLDRGLYLFEKDLITYIGSTGRSKEIRMLFSMDKMKNIFIHQNTIFIVDPNHRKTLRITGGQLSYQEGSSLYNDPQSSLYWSQFSGQVYVMYKDVIYMSRYNNDKLYLRKIEYIPDFNKMLGSLYIKTILYDQENQNLLLGSLTKGLYIINIPQFNTVKKKLSFADNVYYAVLPVDDNSVMDAEGTIYDSLGEKYRDQKKQTADELLEYDKYSLAYNKNKDIFFIKNNKLYKRLKAHNYRQYTPISIPEVIDAVYGKEGLLFVTYVKNNKYYLAEYNEDSKKINNLFIFRYWVNDIKIYNKNQLLIGCMDGLYLGNKTKNEIIKLTSLPIKKIIQTTDQNIWILTKNYGFYLLKKKKLIKMPVDENNYLLDPHTILDDKQDNFWISTNNGLFKVRKKNLLQFSIHDNLPVFYYRYTVSDGLPTNELNGGGNPTGNILSNGQIVLPSLEGLIFFKPENVKSFYTNPFNFYIERAKLDDREIEIKNDILIIPDNRFSALEIFLDFPYYRNLSNADLHVLTETNEWKDLDLQRKFLIKKLQPGNHQIKFRYLGQNNNYSYKTITVKVGYLFYQSIFFKIAVIATACLVLIIVIRFNTSLQRSKNELLTEIEAQKKELNSSNVLREKLIEAISHDIATPIKHLSTLSKKLNETNKPDIQKKYFDSIHKSSEQRYLFTLGLGNYACLFTNAEEEPNPYPLNEVLEEKKSFFENISHDNNTVIEYKPEGLVHTKANRVIISAIVHNILDNAVKNTNNGKIIISTASDEGSAYIRITDNGIGMPKDLICYYNNIHKISIDDLQLQNRSGYGLKFVLLLIDRINSQINFKNNTPNGTIVELKIPN